MSMDITFLGTGSAYPSPTRGASALVLRREGECWLFDCGEGTQTQFMKSHLKAGRITKIFITHLHGDHFFGLPGLLCTLSLQSSPDPNKPPVDIYGPFGLRNFIWRSMELSHSQLLFPYVVHELVPTRDQCPAEEFKEFSDLDRDEGAQGRILHLDPVENSYLLVEDEQLVLKAFRLFHRIPSFGFVVEEKSRTGKLNVQKLKDLEAPIPGRKICILGDCSGVVGDAAVKLCCEADVLIHEATLDDTQEEKAREHGHSTPKMAADFAKLCKVKKLVLTHFSQRYKPAAQRGEGESDITELKRQAESVLGGQAVTLAEDFMTIEIPMKK
ncbi:zinc phosphodiesterase ELAC protein 1 isoform X2 [Strix uralensis]|uniref:zinc phosphodiesterase ELAC protein 1 isoform X2 n=1 Tax=Strix uralensis TaxID=36305 RepID=UPI003DA7A60F